MLLCFDTGAVTKNKDTSTIVPFPVYATNKTTMCFTHDQQISQCNGDMACNHDYWTTMNMTVAIDTMRMSAHHQRLQENRQPGKLKMQLCCLSKCFISNECLSVILCNHMHMYVLKSIDS